MNVSDNTANATVPALLDMEEAAERLGVPLRRLRAWVASGDAPPSCRIGRRRYFRAADCDVWISDKFATN